MASPPDCDVYRSHGSRWGSPAPRRENGASPGFPESRREAAVHGDPHRLSQVGGPRGAEPRVQTSTRVSLSVRTRSLR